MRLPSLTTILLLIASPAAAQQSWTPPDPRLLERAHAILREVPLVDGHNDLPLRLLEGYGGDLARGDLAAGLPRQHTDLARMRRGGVGAQFWSAYVDYDSVATGAALRQALRQVDMIHRMTERYPELQPAITANDIRRIHAEGRIASLIGLEGGHAIENSLAVLRMLHGLGVRYMTLTHSKTVDWADAATDRARFDGLSPFGEEVVREMNRLGMFVDLSHVSPATMRDALRVSRAPVIFSHSSARAVVDLPRNVPDDILRLLPENGGVVMINFCSCFIPPGVERWTARRDSVEVELRRRTNDPAEVSRQRRAWEQENPMPRGTVATVADHIDHIRSVAGVDHLGIGSDYDGVSQLPVGLEDVSTFPVLFAELLRRGYSEEDVKKIAGLNLLRAMDRMEAVAAELQRERDPAVLEYGGAAAGR